MKRNDFWADCVEIVLSTGLFGLILIPLLRRIVQPQPLHVCPWCAAARKLGRIVLGLIVIFAAVAVARLGWRMF